MDNSNSNIPNNIGNSYTNSTALDKPDNAIPTAENNKNTENKSINSEKTQAEAPQQKTADNKAQPVQNNPYINQPTPQIPITNYADNVQQAQSQWNNQPIAYNQHVNPIPTPPQWNNQPPVYNQQANPVPPQWNNQPTAYNQQANPVPPQWNSQPTAYNQQANPVPPQQFNHQPTANNQQANIPQPSDINSKENTTVNNTTIPNGTDTKRSTAVPNNVYTQNNTDVHNTPNQQEATYKYNAQANPNIYTQPYSTNLPHIEYVPYIPGAPLPKGVTPQFINGGWYYPITINPKKQKRKMATSVKVFVGIIVALTISFTGLLVGWTIHLAEENGGLNDDLFFEFELPFTEEEENKPSSGALANPDGPEIKLDKNITKDGSTEKAYDVLSESVVSISVYDSEEQPSTSTPISEGTGIIVSEDGYIVTNSHVILDDGQSNTWVTTKAGDIYPVGIVGYDIRTDLAVLKCEDVTNWKPASFANSDDLSVGQDVVALGSPGGSSYSQSLTRGIVSALDRVISGSAVTYIQTDAAINPGNSGGPLANMNGQVIGINTIKVVDTQFEGMGFAIPSVTIKEVADEIIKNGYVAGRARLGLEVTEFSDSMAKYYDAPAGIKIASIDKESSVDGTDVKEGDIITEIDGTPISNFNDLYNVLDSYKPGDTVTLTIYRFDEKDSSKNEEFTVDVELLGD